jgi:hypothetical protein
MAIIVKRTSEGFDKELISEGTIQMVITGVFDLGIQEVKKFESEEYEQQRQVMIAFEVNELLEAGDFAGQRKRYYQKYKLSMHKKAKLFALVKALVGGTKAEQLAEGEFDIEKAMGRNCLGTFEHRIGAKSEFSVLVNTAELIKGVPLLTPNEVLTEAPEWIKAIQAKAIDKASEELDDIMEPVKPEPAKAAPVKTASKVNKKPDEIFADEPAKVSADAPLPDWD